MSPAVYIRVSSPKGQKTDSQRAKFEVWLIRHPYKLTYSQKPLKLHSETQARQKGVVSAGAKCPARHEIAERQLHLDMARFPSSNEIDFAPQVSTAASGGRLALRIAQLC